eukprot:TRINITY_DN1167_c5_g1_i1.p1 TRINITY_DN1167_c5_g1~~TRINITY_DN1167_c5_g1_i1.p1  ORF type:complete len:824 (+),score=166.14 TRINITY_DN1167_c5_g1_i1:138-2474(+)
MAVKGKATEYGGTRVLSQREQKMISHANPSDARELLDMLVLPGSKPRLMGTKVSEKAARKKALANSDIKITVRKNTVFVEAPKAPTIETRNDPPYEQWENLGVSTDLLEVLKSQNFSYPTVVQERTLPTALTFKKDILAAAETGSGKTLAFGLPVIQRIVETLRNSPPVPWELRVIDCLIITPTRELAMQVNNHLNPFISGVGLHSACIVGGMSDAKQLRLLNKSKNKRPHILIATPGRLWALLKENESEYLSRSISRSLKYLIVDEADKMIQAKHFEEMGQIMQLIHEKDPNTVTEEHDIRRGELEQATTKPVDNTGWKDKQSGFETQEFQEYDSVEQFLKAWKKENKNGPYTSTFIEGVDFAKAAAELSSDEEDDVSEYSPDEEMEEHEEELQEAEADELMEEQEEDEEEPEEEPFRFSIPDRLRVFITSATLMLEAKYHEGGKKITSEQQKQDAEQTKQHSQKVDMLRALIDAFQLDEKKCFTANCVSTDNTKQQDLANRLQEMVVHCLDTEKDLTTYYFLSKNKGRTIVFVNAISSLRRLCSLLTLLNVKVYPLHSEMQQRQRLKNLDRLRADPNCVIVATDVAARGLDIKGVKFVIHYQFPRNTDTYVHRCGRTARVQEEGFSLSLVSPEEKEGFNRICGSLGKDSLQTYPIDFEEISMYRPRLTAAKALDKAMHSQNKVKVHNNWLEKNAREMEMELDPSLRDNRLDGESQSARQSAKIAKLKHELKYHLAQPLTRRAKGSFIHSAQRASYANAQQEVEAKVSKTNRRMRVK